MQTLPTPILVLSCGLIWGRHPPMKSVRSTSHQQVLLLTYHIERQRVVHRCSQAAVPVAYQHAALDLHNLAVAGLVHCSHIMETAASRNHVGAGHKFDTSGGRTAHGLKTLARRLHGAPNTDTQRRPTPTQAHGCRYAGATGNHHNACGGSGGEAGEKRGLIAWVSVQGLGRWSATEAEGRKMDRRRMCVQQYQ